ncbi:putative xanthine-guanine phosphoribosyl transferase Xpt1 [Protomyces lactucae-debilis]|uniref:Putative xanthine-guanine phosphoribosyl transferase Xpt1 n=1 Tax=Protomyces lactucae-debilis TaxID=2754530 RepID=A0A1Y2FF59_PROLT|nr:putative xanthine-guanine phosphoribosyl transferase Xpt1 [Protomyces lactucae-debilis]ORY82542.1 putative xanthine-guanine phosphoribosyl transferase Xpt1 [Protomyces lactucae-debilis]
MATAPDGKVYVSYDQIHTLCQVTGDRILAEFKPDLIIAIGGGGFIPARILRTFLKVKGEKNIPIQAIGLVLYEDLGSGVDEQIGAEVQRVQWLDFSTLGGATLAGKRILIVDEVDDTRTTLHYALRELKKDAKKQAELKGVEDETEFGIFVVHNKQKPKKAELEGLMDMKRYYAGKHVGDEWICYPWESKSIEEHTRLATA